MPTLRTFILKTALLTLTISILMAGYFLTLLPNRGSLTYSKTTTPQQPSLVIGSSRGVMAIAPTRFNTSSLPFEKPLYNFCFSLSTSPYGSTYNQAIFKKLHPSTTNGLYLLEVNPFSLSINTSDEPRYKEKKALLSKIKHLTWNPNLEFIFKAHPKPYIDLLAFQLFSSQKLTKEGQIISDPLSEKIRTTNKKKGLEKYKKRIRTTQPSNIRQHALNTLIQHLKPHGKVILFRAPIPPEMLKLENQYMPLFNRDMQKLAEKTQTTYIDFSQEITGITFRDHHHLMPESATTLTLNLLKKITPHTLNSPDK